MDVRTTTTGRALTVRLRGELDHYAAREAILAVERALDAALPSSLTMDFGDVTFMDSSGIAVAMRAMRRMAALGGTSALVNVPPQAKRVFDAAGILCAAKEETT